MSLGKEDPRSLKENSLRLFLESYFDIAIGTFINLMAFYQAESLADFGAFFSTPTDFINSMITIVMAFSIFYFPYWMFKRIYN